MRRVHPTNNPFELMTFYLTLADERRWLLVLLQLEQTRIALQAAAPPPNRVLPSPRSIGVSAPASPTTAGAFF